MIGNQHIKDLFDEGYITIDDNDQYICMHNRIYTVTKPIKAYKATNINMACLDKTYEMNKLHHFDLPIVLCGAGYHGCFDLKDVNRYYSFSNTIHRFFEVEIPVGAHLSMAYDKLVTNQIKFVRELDSSDFKDIGWDRTIEPFNDKFKIMKIGFRDFRTICLIDNKNIVRAGYYNGGGSDKPFTLFRDYLPDGNIIEKKNTYEIDDPFNNLSRSYIHECYPFGDTFTICTSCDLPMSYMFCRDYYLRNDNESERRRLWCKKKDINFFETYEFECEDIFMELLKDNI